MSGRPTHVPCVRCSAPIPVKDRGPIPDYCGGGCRTRAYEERRRARKADQIAADLSLMLMDRYGVADGDIVDWVRERALEMGRLR